MRAGCPSVIKGLCEVSVACTSALSRCTAMKLMASNDVAFDALSGAAIAFSGAQRSIFGGSFALQHAASGI